MSNDPDLEAFEADLEATLRKSREAFTGKYKEQLNELAGLSRADLDSITVEISGPQKYDELMAVVKAASRANLSQAELKKQIERLGTVAVAIAKKAPSLAALFV